MDSAQVAALKEAVDKLKEDPTLANDPQFKDLNGLLKDWGAKAPPAKKEEPKPAPEPEPSEEEEEEEPEEPEEQDPDLLPADAEPYPEQGPSGDIELTDDQQDKIGEFKQAGAEALEDGDLQKALDKYTEAVKMGATTAMVYAKRAEILLKLKRPNACIADCTTALAANPDSGKAYRTRGKAHRLLGNWESAHKDLSMGQQIDFDDDLVDLVKLVADKNKKIAERQTRLRLKEEKKALKEKAARRARAQKAYEEQKAAEAAGGMGGFPGMPGGMGGMPGMPAGIDPSMLQGLLQDPELLAALQNPKMAGAMQEIMTNPAAMSKYADDPEIMGLVQKLMAKMGGAGADLGAMFGGMGGDAGGDDDAAPSGAPPAPDPANGEGPTVEELD